MVVKNITTLDKDEVLHILKTSSKKEYNKRYIYLFFVFVLGLAVLITGLVSSQSNTIIMGGAITALGIGFFVYSLIDLKKLEKRIIKNNPDVTTSGATYNYLFKENSVQIIATMNNKNKKSSFSYTNLKSIREYKAYYELTFNVNDTLFVYKSGFEDKKMEDFFRKNITTTKKKIKLVKEK